MADTNVNQFFKRADLPSTAMAHILMELDDQGHLNSEMREALKDHSSNYLETLPGQIQSSATAAASAISGNGGLDERDAANVFYAIATKAEMMHSMGELHYHFSQPSRKERKLKAI